ncbi:MAG: hypothetical protein WCK17_03970 [Verrucomicrobiota bacterium]
MTGDTLAQLRMLFQHAQFADGGRLTVCADELASVSGCEVVAAWASYLARGKRSVPDNEFELSVIIQGWRHYYGANYEAAGQLFHQAWAIAGASWRSWSALGMGKVASDLGHWSEARDWLLDAAQRARQENDLYRLAEAYGSLGEVFLRAGFPKPAFELFVLDADLLPPGSAHVFRLRNYMGLCLGRLKCQAQAEALLWECYYAAADCDPMSAAYSLSSLAVLAMLNEDRRLFSRVSEFRTSDPGKLPCGIIQVVTAYFTHLDGKTDESVRLLRLAADQFGDTYPIERCWCLSLCASLLRDEEEQSSVLAQIALLRGRSLEKPSKTIVGLIDEHLLNVIGFHAATSLTAGLAQADSLPEKWRFIERLLI